MKKNRAFMFYLCFICVFSDNITAFKMGSCISKKSRREMEEKEEQEEQRIMSQVNFETKLYHYQALNRQLASTRNNELVNSNQLVTDLTNQNQYLVEYLGYEIEKRETLQNLFPILI
jgi:mRNA-degrading endonuclease HigB of HigAB toxin-antitoxin module